jgi:hypothetical protein
MGKEFANDFLDRGTVKLTDKLLIHNITTGVTEYTTVQKLLTALSIIGNVGFGTTIPLQKVHIEGNSAQVLLIRNITGTNNSPTGRLRFTTDNIGAYSEIVGYRGADSANHGLIFNTFFTNVLREAGRILPIGYFGLGTILPTSRLHVVGLPNYANNAAALLGGMTAGAFYYETGSDPAKVCVVV